MSEQKFNVVTVFNKDGLPVCFAKSYPVVVSGVVEINGVYFDEHSGKRVDMEPRSGHVVVEDIYTGVDISRTKLYDTFGACTVTPEPISSSVEFEIDDFDEMSVSGMINYIQSNIPVGCCPDVAQVSVNGDTITIKTARTETLDEMFERVIAAPYREKQELNKERLAITAEIEVLRQRLGEIDKKLFDPNHN